MQIVNGSDRRWLDALEKLSGKRVVFFKDADSLSIDAEKTLAKFLEEYSGIEQKYMRESPIQQNGCGCVYRSKDLLHRCDFHGGCSTKTISPVIQLQR